MAMNKRERTLAIGVGVVVGALVLDLWVIEPFLDQRSKLEDMRIKEAAEIVDVLKLKRDERALKEKWNDRRSQGLESDPKDAARQVLGALKDWATESGVVMASVKPEYIESKKELREIIVTGSWSGSSDAMVKFLCKLQDAKFPLRIAEIQLGSRADSEELALQLRLSTLYLTQETKDNNGKKDNGKKVASQ